MDEDDERWVILARWVNSGPTVHGPYRTGEAAERAAQRAWRGSAACEGWDVLLLSDGPVPLPGA